MLYKKQRLGELEKCYALSAVTVGEVPHLLVAAEKKDPCFLFDLDGNCIETVWTQPGGVMTMVPVPGKDGVFLATHKFYSPNDSAEAHLVCAVRGNNGWRVHKIAELPFVHRFDILERDGVQYILACTLKSGHEYKNDWRFSGKLWGAVLPEDPTMPLDLKELACGLSHNHGYTRYEENGLAYGIVSCEEGVFQVSPPDALGESWSMEKLLDVSASDAVKLDLDGDGRQELFVISPFHGDQLSIWHEEEKGRWREVYHHERALPFLHAITGGVVYGCPSVFVGNREGDQQLLRFWYDKSRGQYDFEVVDEKVGPANCMLFERNGHPALLVSNREINEIAVYDIANDNEG